MIVNSKSHLESLLGYSYKKLEEIAENHVDYYYSFSQAKTDQNGKPKFKFGVAQRRKFNPSQKELKHIQNKIKDNILLKIPLIENIRGGVKGQSNIINAKEHQGNRYFFTTDLEKCFPSINRSLVFNSLRYKGIPKNISDLLSKLVLIKSTDAIRETCLPQGTPTSTIMANIVLEKLDKRILAVLNGNEINYTRWVDDLSFSSSKCFKNLIPSLIQIIGSSGFKVSREKTSYRHGNSIVTGLVVTPNTVKLPDKFRNKESLNFSENQRKGRQEYANAIYKANLKK